MAKPAAVAGDIRGDQAGMLAALQAGKSALKKAVVQETEGAETGPVAAKLTSAKPAAVAWTNAALKHLLSAVAV